MLQLIKKLLLQIIDNIDSNNSTLTAEEAELVISALKQYTDKEVRLSKYQSCQYLGISRASFDNYIRSGKLPLGLKLPGFKEKFWLKKDLDKYIKLYKK